MWIYFTGTLQVILSCARGISHALQKLVPCVLFLHSENAYSSNFSQWNYFSFQWNHRVSIIQLESQVVAVCGRCAPTGSSRTIESSQVLGVWAFVYWTPSNLSHLWMCGLSFCLRIMLCTTKYSGWEQTNLQVALENTMQEMMGWTKFAFFSKPTYGFWCSLPIHSQLLLSFRRNLVC